MNQFSKETGDRVSIYPTVHSYLNTYYVPGSVRGAKNTKIDSCDAALRVAKFKGKRLMCKLDIVLDCEKCYKRDQCSPATRELEDSPTRKAWAGAHREAV